MNHLTSVSLALAMALPAPALHAQDATEGAALYGDYCIMCHGADARGDGPMAGALTIAPADLTMLSQGGPFPIFDVVRRIDGRDPLLSHGGEMPIFGRFFQGDGADVALAGPGGQPILVSRPIADLVAFLMEVQQ